MRSWRAASCSRNEDAEALRAARCVAAGQSWRHRLRVRAREDSHLVPPTQRASRSRRALWAAAALPPPSSRCGALASSPARAGCSDGPRTSSSSSTAPPLPPGNFLPARGRSRAVRASWRCRAPDDACRGRRHWLGTDRCRPRDARRVELAPLSGEDGRLVAALRHALSSTAAWPGVWRQWRLSLNPGQRRRSDWMGPAGKRERN